MAQKVDVAIQSYKKPESLIYTLLSLKKQSERHIDTIYINDDCSKDGSIELYNSTKFKDALYPISVKIRENKEASGYTNTLMTKELYWKHSLKERLRLNCLTPLHRLKMMELENDIRYEWAINSTNKDYLYLIHDDIIFYDDVLSLYMEEVRNDERIAITGDLGGVPLCPYGPCGEHCSPEQVMTGLYPSEIYPILKP